jgi:hypothetical protein
MNSKTLLEQAIADAKSISEAAEEVARKKLLESLAPEIKNMVNRKLLMEEDEQSAEKLVDEDDQPSTGDTLALEPSPEQMTSAPVAEPVPEPVPVPSPEQAVAAPVSEPAPATEAPSEPVSGEVPAPAGETVQPTSSEPSDVPMPDFDEDFIIELKPLVDADGGIEDLPVDEGEVDQAAVSEIPEQTNENEVETSLKEAFMKRQSIREALSEIPELKDDDAPFSLSDIPEDEGADIHEDVNLTLNFSDSDSSSDEDMPEFLKDGDEEDVKEMTEEEKFVEEARKLYRKAKKAKACKKESLKEFHVPEKKGFHYGNEDTDPEKDSTLYPMKKGVAFEKVLPPDVKKWIVEAHKALNAQQKKINEQAVLTHQLRLLVKGLTEHNIGKDGMMKLVEALDSISTIKESNNTFDSFIKESAEETPIMEEKVEAPVSEEKETSINEAQRKFFKKMAMIKD